MFYLAVVAISSIRPRMSESCVLSGNLKVPSCFAVSFWCERQDFFMLLFFVSFCFFSDGAYIDTPPS